MEEKPKTQKTPATNTNQKRLTITVDGPEKDLVTKQSNSYSKKGIIIGSIIVILFGVGTGYFLANQNSEGVTKTETGAKMVKTEKVVGSLDENFSDEAEGLLVKGGIDGEGTHHLERDGGEARYVYLTSSVVNLREYEDKQVRVWGETHAAQKAGWLMDVGKLEILE